MVSYDSLISAYRPQLIIPFSRLPYYSITFQASISHLFPILSNSIFNGHNFHLFGDKSFTFSLLFFTSFVCLTYYVSLNSSQFFFPFTVPKTLPFLLFYSILIFDKLWSLSNLSIIFPNQQRKNWHILLSNNRKFSLP